ncbi:MAG TPA: hypothetical protein VGF08_03780 [Terriglobales bacterium]|jgi:hypothetical protein
MVDLAQTLSATNHKLHCLVQRLSAPDAAQAVIPDDLEELLTELLRMNQWLSEEGAKARLHAWGTGIEEYLDLLERLRQLLPALHAGLLTERARLEAERTHLESASSWADSSRQTTESHFR